MKDECLMSDEPERAGAAIATDQPTSQPRCQWCTNPLPEGATTCANCGSSATDPTMSLPDAEPAVEAQPEAPTLPQDELAEWWNEEVVDADGRPIPKPQASYDEVEQRRMQTLKIIGGALLVCAVRGWLLGPALSGPLESLTGTPVEDSGELRSTGLFLGVLAGLFVGAISGMAIWSGK